MSAILAIDSSTRNCTVALNINGTAEQLRSDKPREHANVLLPMVTELLDRAGLALNRLDAIAFVSGPGSFTGLRIGCGIAQGLAFGAAIPVIPVSSLAVMAMITHREFFADRILVALSAREGELYCGAYEITAQGLELHGREAIAAPESLAQKLSQSLTELRTWTAAGNGWKAVPDSHLESLSLSACHSDVYPNAGALLDLAALKFERGETVRANEALPVYLKEQLDYEDAQQHSSGNH